MLLLIKIVIATFLILEFSNVLVLYFFPKSTKANGLGIFKAYQELDSSSDLGKFVQYLINWIAGAKLLFISILFVLLFIGNENQLYIVAIGMSIAILSFYWRLYPIIKDMDKLNLLTQKGFAKQLAIIIGMMALVFGGLALYYFTL